MRVRCLTSFDELLPYADDWQHLAAGVPFRSWTWLSHWWRHYGPQDRADRQRMRLAVLCVFDHADVLVGIAPWYVCRNPFHGWVVRPLGSGKVCSDYLSILCLPHAQEAVAEALAEYLLEAGSAHGADGVRWDLLDFAGIDADDGPMGNLVQCLDGAGCTIDRRPGLNCWRLALPVDWKSYVARLSRNLRRDVHKIQRDLLDSGRATLHSVVRPEELPGAMQILVELHERRRLMLGEHGCFASPPFLRFYHDVVPELFRRGLAELHWLECDGRSVAADFQLVGRGTLYAYQAGIDPASMKLQPGKAIYLAILRQAIERGNATFDFLRGDEPYKARFGAQPWPTVNYRIVPRRVLPRVRHHVWLAGKSVKQIMVRRPKGNE